jgi:glutamate/tyrosine decarboxylase-like PLP-dependent enzyme
MARMLEQLVALARDAAPAVDADDELELLAEPSTVMVVFRWRPGRRRLGDDELDAVNIAAGSAAALWSRDRRRTRLDGASR